MKNSSSLVNSLGCFNLRGEEAVSKASCCSN